MTSFVSLWLYSPLVIDLQVISIRVLTFLNSIPHLGMLNSSTTVTPGASV